MTIIVQKFGGTSVANVECIKNAARRIAFERKRGYQLVVVVSAMAGVTNRLIEYVESATPHPNAEEYDVVVSSGEQVTSGLLALALQNFDIPAQSFQAWQIPIQTDDLHAKARIDEIATATLEEALRKGIVPIISGFQGLSPSGRITTFGRGGSDITAVALAAALKAQRCDLYKDVSGIYTADPRIVPGARKLDRVSYEEMLELASLGSKVLQHRAIELAMSHKVPVRVFSSFEESTGTEIVHEDEIMEKALVHGIACTHSETKITLTHVTSQPGTAAEIFGALADAGITVDMIIHNSLENKGLSPLTFTISRQDLSQAQSILQGLKASLDFGEMIIHQGVAKISVVGIGLRSHSHLTGILFRTLSQRGIEILGVATSEIKISILVHQDFAELASRSLHSAYHLDEEETGKPALYAVGQ
jgi:aspartate kinase